MNLMTVRVFMIVTTGSVIAVCGILDTVSTKRLDQLVMEETAFQNPRNFSSKDVLTILETIKDLNDRSLQFLHSPEYEETVKSAMKKLSSEFIGLMAFSNADGAPSLNRILDASTNKPTVVLMDLPEEAIKIFKKMKEQMLKSHLVNWLLILEGEEAESSLVTLENLIAEGTRVLIFTKDSRQDLHLFRSQVDQAGVTRYRAVLPPDGIWGNPQADGTVNGIIGMIARREVTLGVAALGITVNRARVVDFTLPYFSSKTSIYSRSPKVKNKALAILSPFNQQVWLSLCATVLLMGPVMYLFSYLMGDLERRDARYYSLQSCAFNVFRSFVNQGNFLPGGSFSERWILLLWVFFCLVFSASYSGMLTAVLAIPTYETPIDSLHDLPRAIKEGFTLGIIKGTSLEHYFKDATEGAFKQTWELFNHEEPSKSFIPGALQGLEKVLEEKFAFIADSAYIEVVGRRLGKSRFHFSREQFLPGAAGIGCQMGSPFRNALSQIILRLVEMGIIPKNIEDEYRKIRKDPSAPDEEPKNYSVTLIQLQAAFYMTTLGVNIATVVLILEKISYLVSMDDNSPR
ncbi:glutamate receptor ionotropic, delta-2-like [Macrobrachium nipponense]|uniref:glutamate receptor ionotropic, delta-2-like n=1 Tax=Macrobrachium nipponense TaxID=159736 RepID=UPI0030C7A2AA